MRYTLFEQLEKVLEKDERLVAEGELACSSGALAEEGV